MHSRFLALIILSLWLVVGLSNCGNATTVRSVEKKAGDIKENSSSSSKPDSSANADVVKKGGKKPDRKANADVARKGGTKPDKSANADVVKKGVTTPGKSANTDVVRKGSTATSELPVKTETHRSAQKPVQNQVARAEGRLSAYNSTTNEKEVQQDSYDYDDKDYGVSKAQRASKNKLQIRKNLKIWDGCRQCRKKIVNHLKIMEQHMTTAFNEQKMHSYLLKQILAALQNLTERTQQQPPSSNPMKIIRMAMVIMLTEPNKWPGGCDRWCPSPSLPPEMRRILDLMASFSLVLRRLLPNTLRLQCLIQNIHEEFLKLNDIFQQLVILHKIFQNTLNGIMNNLGAFVPNDFAECVMTLQRFLALLKEMVGCIQRLPLKLLGMTL